MPIPPENIHRARGEAADPAAAAIEYEAVLRECFGHPDDVPTFDLVLLGMGEDGHVASLFPGSDGWAERERWVVDHYVVKRGERVRRLTLTMPVLTAAREVVVLVSGHHILYIEATPCAYLISSWQKGVLYGTFVGHDPKYGEYSPGSMY